MWLKSFKSPLVHHLKICKFLRCTIFEWDPASEQLVVAKRKYYIHFRKFLLFTHVLYVVAISLKLILGKDPIAAKCQGIVFLVMLFGCLATRWNFSVISDPCQSMNYFITWEKSIRKNGKQRKLVIFQVWNFGAFLSMTNSFKLQITFNFELQYFSNLKYSRKMLAYFGNQVSSLL